MLYINDLIQKLIKIRNEKGKMEVCKVGHFGEINEMDIFDVYTIDACSGAFGDGQKREVVNIDAPDIGPDPD